MSAVCETIETTTQPGDVCAPEKVYIVLSQTGSIVSRILKLVTRAPYNHSSIAFTEDLNAMYSFGRLRPYNPFVGGFVEESLNRGTFKRFRDTKIMVLELEVHPDAREQCRAVIDRMMRNRRRYRYNYEGLFLAAVHIHYERSNCYYCSEFVKELAETMELDGADTLPSIAKPVHLLNLKHRVVYVGRMQDYVPPRIRPAAVGAM